MHEKSFLLPLLPLTILFPDMPYLLHALMIIVPFSMFPLLHKDGLVLAYLALTPLCYHAARLMQPVTVCSAQRVSSLPMLPFSWSTVSLASVSIIHAVSAMAQPPARYPYLFDAAVMAWCFGHFSIILTITNVQQWREFAAS